MKNTLSFFDFCDGWPESRKDSFSYNGKKALFDYLEQYEEDTGIEIEFDPVSLDCDFVEYKTAWEAMEQYQPEDMPTIDDSEGMDLVELNEAQEAEALAWLEYRTSVITFDGGIIIQNF